MGEWSPFRAYSAKRTGLVWQDWLTAVCLLGGALWFAAASQSLPAYAWNWQACLQFFYVITPEGQWRPGLLLHGLLTTLRVGFWTFLFALITGGLLGVLTARKPFWDSVPYQLFINLLRNTPPLILLFCLYFITGNIIPVRPIEDAIRQLSPFIQDAIAWMIAPRGQIDRMLAAVLALGLYQSAYVAEITRGSLESVPMGQWDAGKALGFGQWQIMKWIILPQGLKLAIAPLTSQCITTFKESSLASLISLPDLTFQSLEIMAITGMTFEIWICTAIIYLLLGGLCALAGKRLEQHCMRYGKLTSYH